MTKKLTIALPFAGLLALILMAVWFTLAGTTSAQQGDPAITSRPLTEAEWATTSPRATTESGASAGAADTDLFGDSDIAGIEAGVVVTWSFPDPPGLTKYTVERRVAETVAGETYTWRLLESNLQVAKHDDVDVAASFSYYYRITKYGSDGSKSEITTATPVAVFAREFAHGVGWGTDGVRLHLDPPPEHPNGAYGIKRFDSPSDRGTG